MERIIRARWLPGKRILRGVTEEGEVVYLSDSVSALARFAQADDWEYSGLGTYSLGYRDREGRVWFGGCDPSNFINLLHPEGEEIPLLREKGLDPEEEIWVWRPGYLHRVPVQVLSAPSRALQLARRGGGK